MWLLLFFDSVNTYHVYSANHHRRSQKMGWSLQIYWQCVLWTIKSRCKLLFTEILKKPCDTKLINEVGLKKKSIVADLRIKNKMSTTLHYHNNGSNDVDDDATRETIF